MSDVKTPVKKITGNKNTELVIGAAAQKLETAVKAIADAANTASKLQDTVQTATLQVVNLEDRIGGLEQEYKNKEAQAKISLQQAFDSNREGFVKSFLSEKGLTSLPGSELTELQAKLEKATKDVSQTVAAAVGAATGAMKITHENELKIKDLTNQTTAAENTARIKQLEEQNKFLTEQVQSWKDSLTAERAAGIERAKSGAINTLNVGTGNASR